MPSINLLPGELVPKGSVVKIAGLLRRLVVFASVILIVVAAGLLSLFVLGSISLKATTQKQEALKASIKSLEQTESGLVLLKDRLDKIKGIYQSESSDENVRVLGELTSSIPAGVVFSQAEIDSKKTQIGIMAPNSASLTRFLSQLISSNLYKSVSLKSFSFNPVSGYSLNLDIGVK